jgi:membrane protease YdiL (CAAX protease family)
MTLTVALILAFPLFVGLTFGVLGVLRPESAALRHAPVTYLAVLSGLAAAVWALTPPDLLPRLWFGADESLTPALWVVAGVAAGVTLFAIERALLMRRHPQPAAAAPIERLGTPEVASLLVIASVEEWLYRGVLLQTLIAVTGLTLPVAVAVAAVAFGLNHVAFGPAAVVSKSAFGVVWGGFALGSGGVAACIASHVAFNAAVCSPLNRRAAAHPS